MRTLVRMLVSNFHPMIPQNQQHQTTVEIMWMMVVVLKSSFVVQTNLIAIVFISG